MSKGKLTALIVAGVMLLYSICAIGLYLVITYFAPQKNVEITVNAGQLANVTDEDEKWIINVEYYSNHSNNGVEMLDVKFNYYMSDEELKSDDPSVYSKGIQIVGDKEGSIQFESKLTNEKLYWLNIIQKSYAYKTYSIQQKTYYYDTQNGISYKSIDALDSKKMFQISIGENETAENYLMKFLGLSNDLVKEQDNFYNFNNFWTDYNIYENYDINHFLFKILGVCRSNSVGYGADGYSTVDLSNIFAYQKMSNGAYTGEWLTSERMMNDKIVKDFNNYFTIRIKTHENGATKASDSMFGMIEGKQDYEALAGSLADNYFHGEQTITLTEKDFDYLYVGYKKYLIMFKRETVDYIKKNVENNKVNIILNLNQLENSGVYFDYVTNGIIYKDKLYYSVENKIGNVYLQRINVNGSISTTEVTK